MPIIIALTVIIQACFIFHVFKTGRPYWWAFIILSFPVIGCVAYYFVEIFPNSREHRAALKAAHDIARTVAPHRELKRRIEEMQICGSVDNRAALAEECVRSQMYSDAVSLYESCLSGIYASDPNLLLAIAEAYLLNGQFEEASATLGKLKASSPSYKTDRVSLLLARVAELRGDDDTALLEYERLAGASTGLEAKVRYGLLLRRLGFERQSNLVLGEVVRHSARFPALPQSEREWVELAHSNLAAD